MFRYFILLLCLFAICRTSTAQEQEDYSPIVHQFKTYFNKHLTDSIYQQWSESAQLRVPKSQLDTLLETKLYPLGNIEAVSLLKKASILSYYKLSFKQASIKLILSADTNNKIETFLFQPYTDADTLAVPSIDSAQVSQIIADTISQKQFKKADNAIDALIDSLAIHYTALPNTAGLAIGVIANGKKGYYYYGETTHGNGVLPDKETLFEIGSISKTFTALLLSHAVLQGDVKLDDPIIAYLPDSIASNPDLKGITFQNLATHTSGLPRMPGNFIPDEPLDPYRDYDTEKLYSYLKNYKKHQQPDSVYEYSNLGYGIIGELLAHRYKRSYNDLITEIICNPLGLHSTTAFPDDDQLSDFIPTYKKDGQVTAHWHFQALSGAGALKSTIIDLLQYASAHLDMPKSALGKAIALTHKPSWLVSETQDLGLAWHINIENFQEIFWHNGGTFGSSSFLAFIPEKNIAVVVLANAAQTVDDIGFTIIRKLMNR